jgi:hypothetical protein
MSPYVGLEPAMWRGLLTRAAVLHATRTRIPMFCELLDRDHLVQLVWLNLITRINEYSSDDLDDDAAVARVVRAWDDQLLATLGLAQLEADVRQLLADLRELVCLARGTDPFLQIFTGVAAQAKAVYQNGWRNAALGLAYLGEHPRRSRDPYAVTAVTPWPPDDAVAEVELRIQPELFGPAAFAALPMLLTHELVCHVPARHDCAANDSTFAEGLLDWVAYFYHDNWAVTIDRELAPAARGHAESLRHILTWSTGSEGLARRIGHQAARDLQVWFESECGHAPGEAEQSVAQLAVQLNTVDRSLAEKDHFVSLLGPSVPPPLAEVLHGWEAGELPAEALLDVELERV